MGSAILVVAGLVFTYNTKLNYLPDASDVEYITTSALCPGEYTDDDDYIGRKLSNYRIQDKGSISLILDALKNTADKEKNLDNESLYSDGNNEYIADIHIGSGLFEKVRTVYIPIASVRIIVGTNAEIKHIYTELPEYDSSKMTIDGPSELDESKKIEVYNSLVEEVRSVDCNKWIASLFGDNIAYDYICISSADVNRESRLEVPITEVTPKTLELAVNYINDASTADTLAYIKDMVNNMRNEDVDNVAEDKDSYEDDEDEDDEDDEDDERDYADYYGTEDEDNETEDYIEISKYDKIKERLDTIAEITGYDPEDSYLKDYDEVLNVLESASDGYGSRISFNDAESGSLYVIEYETYQSGNTNESAESIYYVRVQ